ETNAEDPIISVSNAQVVELDGSPAKLIFTVTLSKPAENLVSVDYATSDGTAIAGKDYTGVSGVLLIPKGDLSKTIVIDVTGDNISEPAETLTLNLSKPIFATLGTSEAKGTIVDDDTTDIITIDENELREIAVIKDGLAATHKYVTGPISQGYDVASTAIVRQNAKELIDLYEEGASIKGLVNHAGLVEEAKVSWQLKTKDLALVGKVGEYLEAGATVLSLVDTFMKTGDSGAVGEEAAAQLASAVAGRLVGTVVRGGVVMGLSAIGVVGAGPAIVGALAGYALYSWTGADKKIESAVKGYLNWAKDGTDGEKHNRAAQGMIAENGLEVGSTAPEAYWEFNADTNTFRWLKQPDTEVLDTVKS
ncbi:hypothetical protein EON80_31340, partial [bacterium]